MMTRRTVCPAFAAQPRQPFFVNVYRSLDDPPKPDIYGNPHPTRSQVDNAVSLTILFREPPAHVAYRLRVIPKESAS